MEDRGDSAAGGPRWKPWPLLWIAVLSPPAFAGGGFSFHDAPPRWIPGSYVATETVNATRVLTERVLSTLSGCSVEPWSEAMRETCSPENLQVFRSAVDEAHRVWLAAAAEAAARSGGPAQAACESSARLIHRDVRAQGPEQRDDRLLKITQQFEPTVKESPDLASFTKSILELQPGVPNSISRYRERVCAPSGAVAPAIPEGASLADLLVADRASKEGGLAWICGTSASRTDDELLAEAIASFHSQLLKHKEWGLAPDFDMGLQPTLGGFLRLYIAPSDQVGATARAMVKREVDRELGTNCPYANDPGQVPCACRMMLAAAEMEKSLSALELKNKDRIERLRQGARERYFEMIDRSALSPGLKDAIHRKYDAGFPPLRLSPEIPPNASYSKDDETGREVFDLNLSTLQLPDETILDIFDHENGHFFAYSLESPELQAALTPGDAALLGKVRACADRSVAFGEFLVEERENVKDPGRRAHRERVEMKRDEALGDIFIRGHRKLRPGDADPTAPPGEGLFCPELDSQLAEISRSLFPPQPDSATGPGAVPTPADRHVNDPHSRDGWRIPWLAQSLGMEKDTPRGARCEDILWR